MIRESMNQAAQADHAVEFARDLLPGADLRARLDVAIDRAQRSLIALQNPEGYWLAPLEANAETNAEFIIFSHFMGAVDNELEARLASYLFDLQQPDGSWNLFPGGEGDLSTSIEAYFALKLTNAKPDDARLMAARRWIMARGGISKGGTLARFYLAALDQVPWSATPAIPAELALLPTWFPANLYELSSWARGTLVGLMVLQATKPTVKVEYRRGVLELYIFPPHFTKFKPRPSAKFFSLQTALNAFDHVLRFYDRHHPVGLRLRALRYLESWLLEHQDANGSWGGIEPCYLLSAMALKGLGYRNDHPVIKRALRAARELVWEMGDGAIYMPCVSPNWDSSLAAKALLDSGIPGDHPTITKAAEWLISRQIYHPGDWSVKRPGLQPGGWAFQFFNDWYPDVDDSAVILMVLAEAAVSDPGARERAIAAGANWVLGMQSKDGGFAAFDVDNNSSWLNQAPFADAEACTDPTCPDLAGRVLEMMAAVGYDAGHPVAQRTIAWLRHEQGNDGSWWGRWGVNYIYGTFSALSGLRAIGIDPGQPWIQRAIAWLKSKQNPDGGWGESCLSDRDHSWRGRGPSTPSQTAWGLIGLLAGEKEPSENALRAAWWLLERQSDSGGWTENEFTGTGFPNHFYLRYHLYAHYFPLMALGRLRRRLAESAPR
jgi:squalene-hopene/tetraprenyl-beta-curcumene cyclase